MRIIFFCFCFLFLLACSNQREVRFEQVYSGINGPAQVGSQYFTDMAELDKSWIRGTLGDVEYQKLVEKVNFSKHLLVAFSAGRIASFSGKIKISSIYQYTGTKDLPMNLRVNLGVLRDECVQSKTSVPFAIAVIERPVGFHPVGGFDVSTFSDSCSKSQ